VGIHNPPMACRVVETVSSAASGAGVRPEITVNSTMSRMTVPMMVRAKIRRE